MKPIDNLLSRLDKVSSVGHGRYKACCPAHGDSNPSMTIKELNDGKVLIHCFTGCQPIEILDSIGLSLGDLFPEGSNKDLSKKYSPEKDKYIIQMFKNISQSGGEITALDLNQVKLALKRYCNGGRV